ncbi:MAG: hypothetical protein NVSMB4_01590 [Acidimicrobiales bacterium]
MKPYVRKRNGKWWVHTDEVAEWFFGRRLALCFAQSLASGVGVEEAWAKVVDCIGGGAP